MICVAFNLWRLKGYYWLGSLNRAFGKINYYFVPNYFPLCLAPKINLCQYSRFIPINILLAVKIGKKTKYELLLVVDFLWIYFQGIN